MAGTEQCADLLRREVRRLSLPPHARVLVAVSGGADSVALLDALWHVSREPERKWELRVGHVHHQLRGEEADDDAAFVRRLAATYGLACDVAAVDTRTYAAENRRSLEAAARELRHAALASMLHAWGGDVVALGHTRGDQAETVLLRLLRGAGIEGLGGMRRRAGYLVRPFLDVDRDVIIQALAEQNLAFRSDSTNLSLHHARNQIRHRVLPAMQPIQARAGARIARSAALLQTEADYIVGEAERTLALLRVTREAGEIAAGRAVWLALHPALQRHTVRLLLAELLGHRRDIDERHVSAIMAGIERSAQRREPLSQLPYGVVLYVTGERFTLRQGPRSGGEALDTRSLAIPGEVALPPGRLSVTLHPVSQELRDYAVVAGPGHAFCDADALSDTLCVRSRRPGDRIQMAAGTRKVQDLMVDRRVPFAERPQVPIVTDAQGIVWVVGLARDPRRGLRPTTERVAWLTFTPRAVAGAVRQTGGTAQEPGA